MTSNESFQVGRALGSLEATLRSNHAQSTDQTARLQRSLDHLIVTLQQHMTAQQSSPLMPTTPSDSRPSLVATLLERVSKKVMMDLSIMLLKKIAASALPYIIPWGIFLAGLTWLGRALLRFLGLS